MSDYLRNLTAILAIGAVFGYIFAPQIDQTWVRGHGAHVIKHLVFSTNF